MAKKQSRFINRELSWLEFNRRVLAEAQDTSIPLLERLRFLAITASNLDEFFMVRVGGLQSMLSAGRTKRDLAGMTPAKQLDAISRLTHELFAEQYRCYLDDLEPQLRDIGVRRVRSHELNDDQVTVVERVFDEQVMSVLTPMAVSTDQQFPLLIGRTISMAVQLGPAADDPEQQPRFAVIPFGRLTLRFITLPSDGGYSWILLEDVIEMFVQRFFPGEDVLAFARFGSHETRI